MAKAKGSNEKHNLTRPALTPEARENQLISYAVDLVEQRLLNGTASSQETTHFLKLGSMKNRLEMQKLEEENKTLLKANNDYRLTIADYKSKLEALEKAGDTDEVVTLRDTLAKVQKDFDDYKATAPNEQDIRSKVEAEYEVKYYRQTELAKHKDDILSIFADEVTGDTKEAIDSSIELVKKKTIDVKKQLGILDSEGNPVEKKPAPKKKEKTPDNPAPATPPVANPTDEGDETFDFDYVQSLDPRSKEYAEFRKKMGLK